MRRAICPHCDQAATIYVTKTITNLVKDHYCACNNFDCRHTFVARSEIIYTICPPMKANPKVHLPQSARFQAKPPATPPTPANDSDQVALAEA